MNPRFSAPPWPRRLLAALAVLLTSHFLAANGRAANDELKVVPLEPDAFDQQLAGEKTYDYIVLPTGELGVKDEVVPFKKIPGHLKRTKPDRNAFFVFWIADVNQVDVAKMAIRHFEKYGATKFAVRQIPPSPPPVADEPAKPKPDEAGQKMVIMAAKPNPDALSAHDRMPSFLGRPEHLRPQGLPPRVRCKFASDQAVVAAAEQARRLLIADEPIATAFIGETVLLQAGAWMHLRHERALADSQAVWAGIPLKNRVLKLETRFLSAPAQGQAAVARVRQLVQKDAGGNVRALTSREMDEWWTFIPFDIEEPVFVVETTKHKYRFVVAFDDAGRINLVDELNTLLKQ